MTKTVGIIGGGFAGLSAVAYLKKAGFRVVLLEKNDRIGGRNRQFESDGFVFDMGPSWYWMPEVFEQFFNDFEHTSTDYYDLNKLNPSFSIFYDKIKMDIPSNQNDLPELFESYEKGAGAQFEKFMKRAKYKYEVGMSDFVQRPSKSILEFMSLKVLKGALKLNLLRKYDKYVRQYFKNPYLIQLMEFPVLFLGSAPQNTPALYSLMNYAGLMLGTWYPQKGMHQVVLGMEQLVTELGVEVRKSTEVEEILVENELVNGVTLKNGEKIALDGLVAAGDYAHMETLLPPKFRNYGQEYWDKRIFAPSSLLFYLGVNKKIEGLEHHNLFFDESLDNHAHEIYTDPKWPTKPLFYVCVPSKTDRTVAPEEKENIFILMPLAAGLEDSDHLRESYFNIIMTRLESRLGVDIRSEILLKRSYCVKDFESDYYSYKGNAYGLANTLNQTAFLKPKLNNKKLKNMVYSGQLTVPGPGMPPAIISGKLSAREIEKALN